MKSHSFLFSTSCEGGVSEILWCSAIITQHLQLQVYIDYVPFQSGKVEVKVKVTCQPASAKPSCSCVYFSYLIRLMGVPVRFVTCSEIRHNEDPTPGNGTESLL